MVMELSITTKTGQYSAEKALDELPTDSLKISVTGNRWSTVSNENRINYEYETLTDMVYNFPRKLRSIYIDNRTQGVATCTPDYLAFLVATLNKTESLFIDRPISHPAEMCCLVAGLLPVNNLQELRLPFIHLEHRFLIQFFQGVATSSLVSLIINCGDISDESELVDEIAKALKTNQTLKTLELETGWGHQNGRLMIQKILSTITNHTEITDLSLSCDEFDSITDNIWMEAFCHERCKVEKLSLLGVTFGVTNTDGTPTIQQTSNNTSIKLFKLQWGCLNTKTMEAMLQHFSSLQTVNLEETEVDTISPFQTHLLQKSCPLQNLRVTACVCRRLRRRVCGDKIGNEEMESFLRNLPKMRSLRSLSLRLLSFFDVHKPWHQILKEVLPQCTLEKLVYDDNQLDEKHAMPLHLNRAGREKMRNELPCNLWPNILERAGKIKYYNSNDRDPTLETPRVDVVYWFLRDTWIPKVSE